MTARRSILAACLFYVTSCGVPSRAQTQIRAEAYDELTALNNGTLVLWIVHDLGPSPQQLFSGVVHLPNTIHETTAGRFGTPAGDIGKDAGNYGRTAGTFGTPAGATGETAGSYGQNAGTFGQNASAVGHDAGNYGRTAGDFGQTAGRYGQSLDTINDADARSRRAAEEAYHHPPRDPRWNDWLRTLHLAFPNLRVEVVDVRSDELAAELKAVRNTPQQPDVLLGYPLPTLWTNPESGLEHRFGISVLAAPAHVAQVEASGGPSGASWHPDASILQTATHPREARAFVVWMQGGWAGPLRPHPIAVAPGSPADVARHALTDLLQGAGVSAYADRDAAPFDPLLACSEALHNSFSGASITAHVDVMRAESNDRFAVVAMRALVSMPSTFGVVDSFAVLRKDTEGRWRVLYVAPGLSFHEDDRAFDMLDPLAGSGHPAHVRGVSQSSPTNGDNRPAQPELAWDNHGGAGLQVVEWQLDADDRLTPSQLFFVPDDGPLLRTRVTASFAATPGVYRWRVWSVGSGGALVLSPWRTFNVVP